jgi:hypothetical protein
VWVPPFGLRSSRNGGGRWDQDCGGQATPNLCMVSQSEPTKSPFRCCRSLHNCIIVDLEKDGFFVTRVSHKVLILVEKDMTLLFFFIIL